MSCASLAEMFQTLSLPPNTETEDVKDFLKFGKLLVYIKRNSIDFIDTDFFLRKLKMDKIKPCHLPQRNNIKGFYRIEEILIFCKRNNLQYLLNMCARVSLNHVVTELKERFCNFKCMHSLIVDVIECIWAFEEENSGFQNDLSAHIMHFIESLFNLLDGNCVKSWNKETIELNTLIMGTIVRCIKYTKVRQQILSRTIDKMPHFIAQIEAYVDHQNNIGVVEQTISYLVLSKEALQYSMKKELQSKRLESKLCNTQKLEDFLQSLSQLSKTSHVCLSGIASICLQQCKTYTLYLDTITT